MYSGKYLRPGWNYFILHLCISGRDLSSDSWENQGFVDPYWSRRSCHHPLPLMSGVLCAGSEARQSRIGVH
jgi:hypothetical protein